MPRALLFCLAVVAALGAVLPLFRAGDDALIGGEYVDAYGTQWFYGYVERALREGWSLSASTQLFHPWGKDLLAHDGANVLDAILASPLVAVLGQARGYNTFVFLAWAAGAWACFRFVFDVYGDRTAAAAAALAFALQPWPLRELVEGRPTQALLGLFVFFVHQLWRTGTRPGLRAPVLAGVSLALLGYQYWYYALFAGTAAVAYGLVAAWRPGPAAGTPRSILGRLTLAAALAVLLVSPVVLPLLAHAGAGAVPGLLAVQSWSAGHTPAVTVDGAAVALQSWQPLIGLVGYQTAASGSEQFVPGAPAFTLPLLGLLLAWAWRPSRLARLPIVAMVAVACLYGTGAIVLVGPWTLTNPVYLAAVKALPFLQRLWWPARAFSIVAVLAPLLLGGILARLQTRPRLVSTVIGGTVVALLSALSAEGLWPLPVWEPRIEAGYRCLARAPEGAIAEVPWGWSQRHLVAQSVHGHPILGGMNERDPAFTPAGLLSLQRTNALVRALTIQHGFAPDQLTRWTEEDHAALGALGYRWIVIQLDAVATPDDAPTELRLRQTRLRTALSVLTSRFGPPVYADARMEIWAPWGHGSPCVGREPAKDTSALGRTERAPPMDTEKARPMGR